MKPWQKLKRSSLHTCFKLLKKKRANRSCQICLSDKCLFVQKWSQEAVCIYISLNCGMLGKEHHADFTAEKNVNVEDFYGAMTSSLFW